MDNKKPPISLIPRVAIEQEAQAFAFGAGKHGKFNFRQGNDYSLFIDAALRHLLAFSEGEDLDPETKLSHLAHGRANLAILMHMLESGAGNDDRWNGNPEKIVVPIGALKGFMTKEDLVPEKATGMLARFPNDIIMGGSKK